MFETAVCFLFLLKLKWPKSKNDYGIRKLSLALYQELISMGNTYHLDHPTKFGACIKNRIIQDLCHRTIAIDWKIDL